MNKSWSPGVSALTRPIWKQEGKYKLACACHFISWLVRACFLCISPNMAFHQRDFATCSPLSFPSSTFETQLQTISFSRLRLTVSRLAPDRTVIEKDVLEDWQCKSASCFVRSRQWFKTREWLWFFSLLYTNVWKVSYGNKFSHPAAISWQI